MQLADVLNTQFEWDKNTLIHRPTGARFAWAYPGSGSDDLIINWGLIGFALDNGDYYELEDVWLMAKVLLDEARNPEHGG